MPAGFRPEITEADLRGEVEWLADEARDGRMTGTAGAKLAADWLADYFRQAGLQSFNGNFAMPFQFNAGERVLAEKTRLEIAPITSRPLRAKLNQDFSAASFTVKAERRAVKWYSLDTVSLRPATTARATILTQVWT